MTPLMVRRSTEDLAWDSVIDLLDRKKIKAGEAAKLAGIPASSMNRVRNRKQPVSLRVLDAAAYLSGREPAELILDPHTEMKVLTPDEAQLLRYSRQWPRSTRTALLTFLDFFADEPASVLQMRQAHEYLRRLTPAVLQRAVAYLLFLNEGGLTPDLRAAFGLPRTDEPRSKPRRDTPRVRPKE